MTNCLPHAPGMCPGPEWNRQPFGAQDNTQATDPRWPGRNCRYCYSMVLALSSPASSSERALLPAGGPAVATHFLPEGQGPAALGSSPQRSPLRRFSWVSLVCWCDQNRSHRQSWNKTGRAAGLVWPRSRGRLRWAASPLGCSSAFPPLMLGGRRAQNSCCFPSTAPGQAQE